MAVLSNLEPKRVFEIFESLASIPHGSRNTKAISDWCVKFGEERGLECHQDAANNVILIAPATPGYENAPAVILQGHLDMVCEKDPGCAKNMETEGLDLFVEGDTVGARGTTLGADDGIAVAMALAALEDKTLQHPRLEAVLTTDEEIGMLGAMVMDVSPLQGRQMLNIDADTEGMFIVGCAGGCQVTNALPVHRAHFAGETLAIKVSGLVGGHSGMEIGTGRANANKLQGRLLRAACGAADTLLVSAAGGAKDNAICAASETVIVTADAAAVRAAVEELTRALKREYRVSDPNLSVSVETAEAQWAPMDAESTRRVVTLLTCTPFGVQTMSQDMPGLVQTSLNLGIMYTDEDRQVLRASIRSSVATQKKAVLDQLICLTEQLGGTTEAEGDYPGWEYMPQSPLRERMVEVYQEQYGKEPTIKAMHAGVECGLFSEKLPGLDCVSFGPELSDIHTPRERMHIASVQRTWELVKEVLKRSKVQFTRDYTE